MLDLLISEPFLGFSKESLDFLSKLKNKRNNNKEWFDKHRDIYEDYIKVPMRSLLDNLSAELKKTDERIVVSPKSVFRINRDVRFKKDKIPYKSHYSAAITYDRIKTPELPLFYFHLSSDEFFFAAGQYSTDNNLINKLRRNIIRNEDKFLSLIHKKDFLRTFGKVNGEALVNVPLEYRSNTTLKDETKELIKMKQMYVFKSYKPEVGLSDELMDLIVKNISITNDFNKFLYDSVK
ncbi:MAG: DUF2461 domain-containing protein [Ignavibacteriota bacterium]|nr:DUF2461 domain-containing protein [Ignavibacteriota bacterium]